MTIQYPDNTSLILTSLSSVSHLPCATMLDDERVRNQICVRALVMGVECSL